MIEQAPKTAYEMTYDDALLYCQFLEYDGYRDWRLPTHKEFVGSTVMSSSWYYIANGQYPDSHKQIVVPVRDV